MHFAVCFIYCENRRFEVSLLKQFLLLSMINVSIKDSAMDKGFLDINFAVN